MDGEHHGARHLDVARAGEQRHSADAMVLQEGELKGRQPLLPLRRLGRCGRESAQEGDVRLRVAACRAASAASASATSIRVVAFWPDNASLLICSIVESATPSA